MKFLISTHAQLFPKEYFLAVNHIIEFKIYRIDNMERKIHRLIKFIEKKNIELHNIERINIE